MLVDGTERSLAGETILVGHVVEGLVVEGSTVAMWWVSWGLAVPVAFALVGKSGVVVNQ